MKKDDLKITREKQLDPALTNEIRDIYFESFPPSERIDFYTLIDNIASARQLLFTVKKKSQLAGFATTIPLSGINIHLLEYMAIIRNSRNHGLGTVLLRYILADLALAGNTDGLILEVEPDDEGTESERQLRKRRIGFYGRNGAHPVECAPSYCIPNMAGEGTVRMRLMWLSLKDTIDAPSGRGLRDCIMGIYSQCYGRSQDDPLLQSVIENLVC